MSPRTWVAASEGATATQGEIQDLHSAATAVNFRFFFFFFFFMCISFSCMSDRITVSEKLTPYNAANPSRLA